MTIYLYKVWGMIPCCFLPAFCSSKVFRIGNAVLRTRHVTEYKSSLGMLRRVSKMVEEKIETSEEYTLPVASG